MRSKKYYLVKDYYHVRYWQSHKRIQLTYKIDDYKLLEEEAKKRNMTVNDYVKFIIDNHVSELREIERLKSENDRLRQEVEKLMYENEKLKEEVKKFKMYENSYNSLKLMYEELRILYNNLHTQCVKFRDFKKFKINVDWYVIEIETTEFMKNVIEKIIRGMSRFEFVDILEKLRSAGYVKEYKVVYV